MDKKKDQAAFSVEIHVGSHSAWRTLRSESASLHTTLGDQHLTRLLELNITDTEQVAKTLRIIPPSFAVIIERGVFVLAAVDRFRSTPLFYSFDHERLILSESIAEILSESFEPQSDLEAIGHFLLCGHTLGDTTFFSSISTLSPGQYVLYNKETKSFLTKFFPSYSGPQHNLSGSSTGQSRISDYYTDAVVQLVDTAAGRPLILPLRGYEEDIMLLKMLRDTGYPDLIAVQYSPASKKRHAGHKQITKSLGIPMRRVDFSRRTIRKAFAQKKRRDYTRFTSYFSALPNYQAYFNLTYLLERDLIPQGSMIVDGAPSPFCGTFASYRLFSEAPSPGSPEFHLWDLFCNFFSGLSKSIAAQKGSTEIRRIFQLGSGECNLVQAIDRWLCNERLPKLLINEKLLYKFLGLDFSFPFVNSGLVECREQYSSTEDAAKVYEAELDRILKPLCPSRNRLQLDLHPAVAQSISMKSPTNQKLAGLWDRFSYFLPVNKFLSPYGYSYFLLNYQDVRGKRECAFAARHLLDELGILGYPQEHLPAARQMTDHLTHHS